MQLILISHSLLHFEVLFCSITCFVCVLALYLSQFLFWVRVAGAHEMQCYITNRSEHILFNSFFFPLWEFHSVTFNKTFISYDFHSIHFTWLPRFPSWSYYKCFPSKILFVSNLFSPDFYESRYTFTNGIFNRVGMKWLACVLIFIFLFSFFRVSKTTFSQMMFSKQSHLSQVVVM